MIVKMSRNSVERLVADELIRLVRAVGLELYRDEEGLALEGDGMVVRADFGEMLPRLRPQNLQRELLVRACRIKPARLKAAEGKDRAYNRANGDDASAYGPRPIRVLDATAGLGEDSLLLAAAGFQVTMYESDPVIAALLGDGVRRAAGHPALAEIVSRMDVVEGDSVAAMRAIGDEPMTASAPPDVIYLDPMFPERQKSGKIKKKFQLIQRLESPCADEEDLLAAAIAAKPIRIVIKRPLKGPALAGRKPSFVLKGKSIRYDCIVL